MGLPDERVRLGKNGRLLDSTQDILQLKQLKRRCHLAEHCSIREKPRKGISSTRTLEKSQKNEPDLIIGVGGCVASQEGDHIRQRAPYVDIIFGPQTLHRLPEMINDIKEGNLLLWIFRFPK